MSDNGYMSFVSGGKGLIKRLLMHEAKLEFASILKLVEMTTDVLEGDRILQVAHRSLDRSSAASVSPQLPLLSSTLCALIARLPAQPLYTYQHLSRRPSSPTLPALCHSLYTALIKETTLALPGLVAYIASSLCVQCPSRLDWSTAARAVAEPYFQALGKHCKALAQPGDLALSMLTRVQTASPTFREYFQVAKLPHIPGFKPIKKLKFALETAILELLSDPDREITEWSYALAALKLLQAHGKSKRDLKSHMEGLIPRIHIRSVYGEVLIWTLLGIGDVSGREDMILDGIPNLSYLNSEESIDPNAIKSLFLMLSDIRNKQIFDSTPLLPLIQRFSAVFDKEMLRKCYNLLKDMPEKLPAKLDLQLNAISKETETQMDGFLLRMEKNRRFRVYDSVLVSEVMGNLASSPQPALLHSLLAYFATVGNCTDHLPALLQLLPCSPTPPLLPLLDLLFLHLEAPGPLPSAYIPAFSKAISSLELVDLDQSVHYKKSGLAGYLPFKYETRLETRRVGSEEKDWEWVGRAEEVQEAAEVWWKASAVMNAFHLPKPPALQAALSHFISSRSSFELNLCVKDFLQACTPAPVHTFHPDPATGWVIDLAFPDSSLAVIFQSKSDLVHSPDCREVSSTLLAKVWKEQLKAVGWNVVGVKKKVWQRISAADKKELVRRIRTKA